MVSQKTFQSSKDLRKQARIQQELLLQNTPQQIESKKIKIINASTMKPQQIYHLITPDFNSFFKDRQFTNKNFNLFFQVLCEQNKFQEAEKIYSQLDLYGFKPTIQIYMFMIELAGKVKEIQKSELYFQESLVQFGWNKVCTNAMIFAYSKKKNYQLAANIFKQAELKGIKIDCILYTSLIQAAYNSKRVNLCWQLYDEMKLKNIERDDLIISYMMRICSNFGECEKALSLWKELNELPNVRLHCLHYNSIIKSLGSRRDYCNQALEFYDEMIDKKIQPDYKTFEYALWSCSELGNIKMAYEITSSLKSFNLEPQHQIFQLLIKTYAVAVKRSNLPHSLRKSFVQDARKIFDDVIKNKQKLTIQLFNNMISCYLNIDELQIAEEEILPMIQQHGLYNSKITYEKFFLKFLQLKEFQRIQNLYVKLKNENENMITFKSLNTALDVYYQVKNVNRIIEILDTFILRKQRPSINILRKLSYAENLPDSIIVRLKSFEYQSQGISNRYYGKHHSSRKYHQEKQEIQNTLIDPIINEGRIDHIMKKEKPSSRFKKKQIIKQQQ